MQNNMIDLETLGNGENGVIPILCAVKFDPVNGEVGEAFYRNIDVHEQIESGREVDADTIAWWFNQGDDARAMLMMSGDPMEIVLHDFRRFLGENAIVWANGGDFDFPKLRHAYGDRGRSVPWKFWNQRDMRTVLALSKERFNPKVIPFEGVKHNAKDDCLHQIKILHLALCALGLAEYYCE
jgi:hypothetical protein